MAIYEVKTVCHISERKYCSLFTVLLSQNNKFVVDIICTWLSVCIAYHYFMVRRFAISSGGIFFAFALKQLGLIFKELILEECF